MIARKARSVDGASSHFYVLLASIGILRASMGILRASDMYTLLYRFVADLFYSRHRDKL